MRHELIIGATQESGKTNAVKLRVGPFMNDPTWSVASADPQPDATSFDLFRTSIHLGQSHRTIFDDLGDTERIIPRDWLLPSSSESYWQREQEDKNSVEMFLDPLARRRGLANLDANPLIREWAMFWSYLMMYQNPRKPLSEGKAAFKPWLPSFNTICTDCTNNDIAWKFRKLPQTVSVLERMANPAERFLDPVLNSPGVKMRDGMGQGFDFEGHLDRGGHYFMQGGNHMSKEEIRFLLSSMVLRVIEYKRSGGKQNVLVILEEAEAFDLVSTYEEQAIKTLQKRGLVFLIVCQSPSFMEDK
ncbi:MAG: hypothetical protein KDA86_25535 [Planctomycetaceae bacterium]|nr:hypothetical protein [Planctomycetaceae bacterium]